LPFDRFTRTDTVNPFVLGFMTNGGPDNRLVAGARSPMPILTEAEGRSRPGA
jgi:hypothetical protein